MGIELRTLVVDITGAFNLLTKTNVDELAGNSVKRVEQGVS